MPGESSNFRDASATTTAGRAGPPPDPEICPVLGGSGAALVPGGARSYDDNDGFGGFRSKQVAPDQEHKPMPRIAFRPLVLIAILALMAVIVGAQAPVPQPEDQETAREVV